MGTVINSLVPGKVAPLSQELLTQRKILRHFPAFLLSRFSMDPRKFSFKYLVAYFKVATLRVKDAWLRVGDGEVS